jgi:uncharacterized glyoxalase superfamily protein PhnB
MTISLVAIIVDAYDPAIEFLVGAQVDDFGAAYARMTAAGVEFLEAPRTEPYGRVVVFRDIAGNKWDLLGPV